MLDFIYPEACLWCEQRLEGERRGSFCLACWSLVKSWSPPWCAVCGIPYPGVREGETCGRCQGLKRLQVDAWRCAGSYEDVLREAIHAFKYQKRRRTTGVLLAWFDEWVPVLVREGVLADADFVMPVPMHLERERERGGNHAETVARVLAQRLGKPVLNGLVRSSATQPQNQLTRGERRANVRRAFGVSKPDGIRGKTVVLVDDIVTTGATVEACARVLRHAGARSVKAVALARSL